MATVYKEGGTWRCIARRKGHEAQSGNFATKVLATRQGNKWEVEFDQGMHRIGPKHAAKVNELFGKYATEVAQTKRGGRWEQIRLAALADPQQHPEFDCLVRHFGREDMRAWKERRLATVSPHTKRPVSAATVNRELNLISAVFTQAIKEWDYPLPANPVSLISRPPKPPARERRVNPDDTVKLQFGKQPLPRTGRGKTVDYLWWIIEFAVETGMRLGEICNLKWQDVHLDEHWLWVAQSKNGEARTVPLSARAEEILIQLGQRESRPFPVNAGSVGTLWRRNRTKLGLTDLHIHDSRREATTRMAQRLHLLDLAAVIGHKDLASLRTYYNPTPSELVKRLRAGPRAADGAGAATPARPQPATPRAEWAD